MTRTDKAIIWLAAFAFVGVTAFAAHRTPLLQLISAPFMVGLLVLVLVSLVRVFTRWSALKWRAILPLTACIAAIVSISVVGAVIRRALFAWSLPSYQQVVRDIDSGRINVSERFDHIPEAERMARLAYAVFAQRKPNGPLFVEFLTEGGFPVKHSGYVYSSSDRIDDAFIKSRWPITAHVQEHWFYVSD